MFDPNADLWEHEKQGTINNVSVGSVITAINADQQVRSSATSGANIIPSIDKHTLDQIRTNIVESQ
jgi:hypothetical protein